LSRRRRNKIGYSPAQEAALHFQSESFIEHGRDKAFFAYRDKLGDIVPFLEDISAIEVLERKEDGNVTRLHNLWRVDQDVPAFARAFLKKEMLCWDDFAVWVENERVCRWEIKTRAFTDAVSCKGSNSFYEDGEGRTRVVLDGDLQIDLKKIRGIPSFLGRSLGPKLERFIVNMVTPNLQKVNASLEAYLNAQD
jgi:hypothetical protein